MLSDLRREAIKLRYSRPTGRAVKPEKERFQVKMDLSARWVSIKPESKVKLKSNQV